MQFISPQQAEAKVAARHRVMVILWMAILASLFVLLILALAVPSSGTSNQTLTSTLLGLSLVAAIVSVGVKRHLLKQAIDKQELQPFMSAYVIAFALCESAALFGLLNHFATGSVYYRVQFSIAAIGMLLHFPKKDHVRAVSRI